MWRRGPWGIFKSDSSRGFFRLLYVHWSFVKGLVRQGLGSCTILVLGKVKVKTTSMIPKISKKAVTFVMNVCSRLVGSVGDVGLRDLGLFFSKG